MGKFRSILSRLTHREEVANTPAMRADLVDKFKALIEKYETTEDLPDDFRRDVEQSIIAVLDLADTVSEPHYAIDEVIHCIVITHAGLNRLLDHTRRARPRTRGFAILDIEAKTMLSGFFFNSEVEAQAMVANLSAIAPTKHYAVKPAEISSFYVHQPAIAPPIVPKLSDIQINPEATPSWQTPPPSPSTPGLPPLPTQSEIEKLVASGGPKPPPIGSLPRMMDRTERGGTSSTQDRKHEHR